MRGSFFLSSRIIYLSHPAKRYSLPDAQRGVLFSPGTREMYVLSRDRKNERPRERARARQNRTRCARGI